MRTRRSPRHQDRLWRALGGSTTPVVMATDVEQWTRILSQGDLSERTREQITRCLMVAQRREAFRRCREEA